MAVIDSTYRIGAFAKLAGVTVRTLHHYDRLGLLRPARGAGGYRVYTLRDLERLEQVVVLKFVGIPLRRIQELLRGSPRLLATHLGAQRGTLERKRLLLDRAIAAIGDLQIAVTAGDAAPFMYKRIIEVIDMQHDGNTWTEQYDELVSKKAERLRAFDPAALSDLRSQWRALVTEIREALLEDPSGPAAQAFADRWTGLLGQVMGQQVDARMLSGQRGPRAWDPRMASFVDQPVWDFMTRVLAARI